MNQDLRETRITNKLKLFKMLKKIFFTIALFSCINTFAQTKNFTQFVNPFIGTDKMGHTFPGATTPYGMVQLSPQTNMQTMYNADGSYNPKTYEYCAGYQYADSTIIGFSHTNFSG